MSSSSSRPVRIPSSPSSRAPRSPTVADQSWARTASQTRLASPIPSVGGRRESDASENQRRDTFTGGRPSGGQTPLAGSSDTRSSVPRESALSNALAASLGRSPSRVQTPPRTPNPASQGAASHLAPSLAERQANQSNYGSFAPSSMQSHSGQHSPAPYEDFDVVRRHLAGPKRGSPSVDSSRRPSAMLAAFASGSDAKPTLDGKPTADGLTEGFSSLRMQGGDITREIYRRTEAEVNAKRGRNQRSQSFNVLRPGPQDEELDIENMRQPGGFRRNHIIRHASSPGRGKDATDADAARPPMPRPQPSFLARNFFEFLSLYGHFAGEDMDDDDDDDDDDDEDEVGESAEQIHSQWQAAQDEAEDDQDAAGGTTAAERRPLLKRAPTTKRRLREDNAPKKGAAGTVFILLKSFVGTGVLFLPRAFLNGGILFSFIVLFLVALVSYYCFLLLTKSRLVLKGSFAEMGEMVHGRWMRFLVNASLVISQIGFASAYIVFTSENLRAFVLAVSDCTTNIDIKLMILMQLIVFLPLSLYRNLNNISFVVYIADVFIVLGLIYLYYYDIATIASRGIADVELFNRDGWTLFIGTAIFTFEGIGLLIPIQDGMKKPQQLPVVLGGVMVIISAIFISMGALSYAAYGSKTETVIILNMPQDNKFVNAVQFLYSLAILLSTPMQIFPAITILEKGVFKKSGKYSKNIKWMKNGFRFMVVMGSAFIAWIGANDLDKFVALVGSFACIPLVYIYPPLIHRKAIATSWWNKALDLLLCMFGVTLMAYTSTLTIVSWVKGGGSDRSRGYCDR